MSFALGIWRPNGLSQDEAEAYYLTLAERPPEAWTPSDDLREFVDEATIRFHDVVDGPWSTPPMVGADEVLLSIPWLVAGAVAPGLLDLAKSRGLVCFDPQSAVLYDPSALTPLSLLLSDGKTIPSPTRRLIERHLRRLADDRWFIIIEVDGGRYVQAGYGMNAGASPERYAVEHRTPDGQWQTELPDLEGCVAAVFAYLDNDPSWSAQHTWTKLEL